MTTFLLHNCHTRISRENRISCKATIFGFESTDPGAQFSRPQISNMAIIPLMNHWWAQNRRVSGCINEGRVPAPVYRKQWNIFISEICCIRTLDPLNRVRFSTREMVRDNMVAILLKRWQWTAKCKLRLQVPTYLS